MSVTDLASLKEYDDQILIDVSIKLLTEDEDAQFSNLNMYAGQPIALLKHARLQCDKLKKQVQRRTKKMEHYKGRPSGILYNPGSMKRDLLHSLIQDDQTKSPNKQVKDVNQSKSNIIDKPSTPSQQTTGSHFKSATESLTSKLMRRLSEQGRGTLWGIPFQNTSYHPMSRLEKYLDGYPTMTPTPSRSPSYARHCYRLTGDASTAHYKLLDIILACPDIRQLLQGKSCVWDMAGGSGGMSAFLLRAFPNVEVVYNTLTQDGRRTQGAIDSIPISLRQLDSNMMNRLHRVDSLAWRPTDCMLDETYKSMALYGRPDLIIIDAEGTLDYDQAMSTVRNYCIINPGASHVIVKVFSADHIGLAHYTEPWAYAGFSARVVQSHVSDPQNGEIFLVFRATKTIMDSSRALFKAEPSSYPTVGFLTHCHTRADKEQYWRLKIPELELVPSKLCKHVERLLYHLGYPKNEEYTSLALFNKIYSKSDHENGIVLADIQEQASRLAKLQDATAEAILKWVRPLGIQLIVARAIKDALSSGCTSSRELDLNSPRKIWISLRGPIIEISKIEPEVESSTVIPTKQLRQERKQYYKLIGHYTSTETSV